MLTPWRDRPPTGYIDRSFKKAFAQFNLTKTLNSIAALSQLMANLYGQDNHTMAMGRPVNGRQDPLQPTPL